MPGRIGRMAVLLKKRTTELYAAHDALEAWLDRAADGVVR